MRKKSYAQSYRSKPSRALKKLGKLLPQENLPGVGGPCLLIKGRAKGPKKITNPLYKRGKFVIILISVEETTNHDDCMRKGFPSKHTFMSCTRKKVSNFVGNAYQTQFITKYAFKPLQSHLISHRCHKRRCLNWKHMLAETDVENSSRNGCKRVMGKCKGTVGSLMRCAEHAKFCCLN